MKTYTLRIILIIAIAIRVIIPVFLIISPIESDKSEQISPFSKYQERSGDIRAYMQAKGFYFNQPFSELIYEYKSYFNDVVIKNGDTDTRALAPLYPALLHLTGYSEENILPLALLFLFIGIWWVIIWTKYFSRNNLPVWGLIIFILIPNPIVYSVIFSTDLLFALFFTLFFINYFSSKNINHHNTKWLIFLILMLLTRPNSLSILLFVLFDYLILKRAFIMNNLKIISVLLLTLLVFGLFYLPYFLIIQKGTTEFTYFGIPQTQFFEGLFSFLPHYLDVFLSVIILFVFKLLYAFGLRPSWSSQSFFAMALRGGFGLISFPGFIYFIKKSQMSIKVLALFFMLPVLLGPSQERYILAIFPVFYFYGIKLIQIVARNYLSHHKLFSKI